MERDTGNVTETKTREENHANILADAGFASRSGTGQDDDGKVWMCFQPGNGQYVEKKDFDAMNQELSHFMGDLAKNVSAANHGAEIEVSGTLQGRYKGTFCSGISAFPNMEIIGKGGIDGQAKMPDEKAMNAELAHLVDTYKKSLKGDPIGNLHIAASIALHTPESDKKGEVLKRYTSSEEIPLP